MRATASVPHADTLGWTRWPKLCLCETVTSSTVTRVEHDFHDQIEQSMRTNKRPSDIPSATVGPRPVTSDRRRRERLRDLCDEVLASFRLAADRDPISEQDRAAAMQLLPRVAPLARL